MNRFRRIFLAAALLAAVALAVGAAGQAPERVTITLLGTTDLHANLMPFDYYRNQASERGLAKVATVVRQIRAEQPHTLLLDAGDTIQGTPLGYYFARKDPAPPNPTIAVMNAIGFDAMAIGNHEFNYGLEVLWKAKRESNFPWLGANIQSDYARDHDGWFPPYVIREIAGVRVAIVGFITPAVPNWEIPAHYAGYRFLPIVDTARRILPEVRAKADVVVVVAHSGLGRVVQDDVPLEDRIGGEDAMLPLAENVPGIDVILFGHSHQEVEGMEVGGALLVQPKNWGQSVARVDLEFERGEAGWQLVSRSSRLIPVAGVDPDPEIVALAMPYHEATEAWLDTPVATAEKELAAWDARYRDHPLVDLIHQVQLHYSGAEISMATKFMPALRIPAGPVTIRQIAGLYHYENTLYAVELTGAEVREALEHAASYFPAWPHTGEGPMRLPGFNADMAEGVSYVVDLARPVGQRIRDLRFRGQPIDPAQRFRVAINNYRHAGGGRYTMYRDAPVLYRSPVEVRDLLIEYVSERGTLPTEANGNWRIEPPEALETILRQVRERGERYGNLWAPCRGELQFAPRNAGCAARVGVELKFDPTPAREGAEKLLTPGGLLATFPRGKMFLPPIDARHGSPTGTTR